LLNLGLSESQTIDCDAEATEYFLKRAIPDDFMHLYSSFLSRWSDRMAIPMLEIGINVAEQISSPRKRFLTIGRIEQ